MVKAAMVTFGENFGLSRSHWSTDVALIFFGLRKASPMNCAKVFCLSLSLEKPRASDLRARAASMEGRECMAV